MKVIASNFHWRSQQSDIHCETDDGGMALCDVGLRKAVSVPRATRFIFVRLLEAGRDSELCRGCCGLVDPKDPC